MNFLTRVLKAAKDRTKLLDPGVKLSVSGGCAVKDGVQYTGIDLHLPAVRDFTDKFEQTSDAMIVADHIREYLDEQGIVPIDSTLSELVNVPAPKKKVNWNKPLVYSKPTPNRESTIEKDVKERDWWRATVWVKCPPPVVVERQALLEAFTRSLAEHIRQFGENCFVDPRFALGEELRTGGTVEDYWSWTDVGLRKSRPCWYVCSVKKDNGIPAHVILRAGSRNSNWRSRLGRTLYARKWCLFKSE